MRGLGRHHAPTCGEYGQDEAAGRSDRTATGPAEPAPAGVQKMPSSSRAAEASFLLGRLDDESAGGASALAWYDRYLAEAPAGAYVSEALGRKMMALERAHRRDEASHMGFLVVERRDDEQAFAHLFREKNWFRTSFLSRVMASTCPQRSATG